MEETVKTFVVPTAWMDRRLPQFLSATGALNSRKHGRMPRGTIQLAGIDSTPQDNGTTVVRVHTRRCPSRKLVAELVNGERRTFCPFKHADIGKLMKSLTVAAAKVA